MVTAWCVKETSIAGVYANQLVVSIANIRLAHSPQRAGPRNRFISRSHPPRGIARLLQDPQRYLPNLGNRSSLSTESQRGQSHTTLERRSVEFT